MGDGKKVVGWKKKGGSDGDGRWGVYYIHVGLYCVCCLNV